MAPFEFGSTGMSGDNPQGSDPSLEAVDPSTTGSEAGTAAADAPDAVAAEALLELQALAAQVGA